MSLILTFAGDFVYSIQNKVFPMPRETFTVVLYSFLGFYKIAWLVASVIPWITLLLMGSGIFR
jgi:hypothetical protein